MANDNSNKINKVLDLVMRYALEGSGPFTGARELADEYIRDTGFTSDEARINTLIKREISKSFGSGFITGLGSGMTLPLSIPVSLFSSLTGEARLVATIALVYGHSLESGRVKSLILLSLAGEGFKDILKSSGVKLVDRTVSRTLRGLSDGLLKEIGGRAGFAALKRLAGSGGIALTRALPLAGGLAGGIIDAVSIAAAGRAAKRIFGKKGESMGDRIEVSIPVSRLSEYICSRVDRIRKVKMREGGEFTLSVRFLPFGIGLGFAGFTEGRLLLSLRGNPLKRRMVSGWLKRYLAGSVDEIRKNIKMEGDQISISLNRLIAEVVNELPDTKISGIRISGNSIIAEIQ